MFKTEQNLKSFVFKLTDLLFFHVIYLNLLIATEFYYYFPTVLSFLIITEIAGISYYDEGQLLLRCTEPNLGTVFTKYFY